MTTDEIKKRLEKMERNSIQVKIKGEAADTVGSSRFGGMPDVPKDFAWPVFETATFDDEMVKPRPLSFLAQFNCGELAPYDSEGLLPKTGMMSFFYEVNAQKWGFDPKDGGCARVYWFEDVQGLSKGEFPAELAEEFRFPAIKIEFEQKKSLPEYEDFACGFSGEKYGKVWGDFEKVIGEQRRPCSKLLGWANIIQNCMPRECELISRGYYLGGNWRDIPKEEITCVEQHCCEDWLLLFQLDSVEREDFELMFGDCGCIYFYIRKEDLAAKNFDRVWLILQCY